MKNDRAMHSRRVVAAAIALSTVIACQAFLDLEPSEPEAADAGDATTEAVQDDAPGVDASDAASDAGSDVEVDAGACARQAQPDAAGLTTYQAAVVASRPCAYFRMDEVAPRDDAGMPTMLPKAGDLYPGHPPGEVVPPQTDAGDTPVYFGEAPGIGATDASFAFFGTDGYLSLGTGFDFAGRQAFSIEFWAFAEIGTRQFSFPFIRRQDSNGYGMAFTNGNQGLFFLGGPSGADAEAIVSSQLPAFPDDAGLTITGYMHIAATFDGDRLRLYLDGVLRDEEPAVELSTPTIEALRVGFVYQGTIDEFAIYDRALAPTEIKDHFHAR